MTAGNVDIGYRLEGGYREPDEEADWKQVARGAEVTELNIDNQLQEDRDSDNPLPYEQLAGNFEGALGITGTLSGSPIPPWAEDLVFHDDGSLPTSGGRAPSAEWAIGLNYVGGEIERLLQGAAVTDATLEWENGTSWSFDLTIAYGFEQEDVEFTPTDLVTLDASKVYNHAATTLEVDALEVEGLSSLSLSISQLARLREGNGRFPYEAVVGSVQPTIDIQADITEESTDNLEHFYGGEGETSEELDKVPITIEAQNKDQEAHEYAIGAAKPNTLSWDQLTDHESNEQENASYNIYDDGDSHGVEVTEV